MRPGIAIALTAAAVLVFAAGDARADGDTARQHFEAGKKLRDEGDCTRAIPEFDKSVAADKSIGGYYNLGYCHEQLSHRQEAYEAYKSAQQLASAKKDDRLREISGALAALLETPHIRLVLPQPLPAGIEIRVDDQLVPSTFYAAETVVFTKGTKTHSVSVTAPGYEERRETVDTKQVKPIELRRATKETASAPPGTGTSPRAEGGGWNWQHWVGLGVGAVGAGLLTLGSVMIISYRIEEPDLLKRYEDANKCPKEPDSDFCTDPVRDDARVAAKDRYNAREEKARDQAPLMIGSAIGGALMIGGGVLLFLSASSTSSTSSTSAPLKGLRIAPIISTTTSGAALGGIF